ncbi:uncharacterized protein LY79DRAFT_577950 [Colletotrichum navitas]|uniref:Uncharacterized protein n=1 Tax=Colletotrichum navitas TaxID=681940 RepID=A0AAD8Q4A8_9PEZI|nr:uncharacterized protein LY79DRAFT_577950 [Colletotrichum navitas]KAK1595583.1 hypothetical protein LY79DRAFT_577950 [Colletotrichum navitas]
MSNALAGVPSLLLDLVECSKKTGSDKIRPDQIGHLSVSLSPMGRNRWKLSSEHGLGHSPSLFATAAGGKQASGAQSRSSQREELRLRGRSRGRGNRRGSPVPSMHVAARLRWTNPEAWRRSVYGYGVLDEITVTHHRRMASVGVWRRGGGLRPVGSVLFYQFGQPGVSRRSQYDTRYRANKAGEERQDETRHMYMGVSFSRAT